MGIILSREELAKISLIKRSLGEKIICACGCFEIFHFGHFEYLKKSKLLGDYLIVGINDDNYLSHKKGRKPLFTSQQRCDIIASLSFVDYVFLFSEKTFSESLAILRPHIFTKGVDRTKICEQNILTNSGIRLEIIGEQKVSSSTELEKYLTLY